MLVLGTGGVFGGGQHPTKAGCSSTLNFQKSGTGWRSNIARSQCGFRSEVAALFSVNEAALRQYGYSHDEFLQMTIHDIRPAEDIPKLQALMKTNEARRIAGVWKHRKKDGTIFFAEVSSGDVVWNDHLAKLVIAPDVSDRIWAERHLVEWKQRHEAAISASGQILYDWNPVTNHVTYSNHLERLGYTTLEMEGGLANWRELIHIRRPAGIRSRDRARFGNTGELLAELPRAKKKTAPISMLKIPGGS